MKNYMILCLMSVTSMVAIAQTSEHPESKLAAKGYTLPASSKPIANYVKYVIDGNKLYLSGHGACGDPTPVDRGKLGKDLTIPQGYEAARNVGLCILATVKDALGDLGRVKRVIKVLGMVNCTPDFTDQPKVMNGFSDLMVEVFGEKGKHVRSAVGMNSLPNGMTVEIEVLLEIEN
ncbi:MAG: RidA family protein [Saprospiraceae bacterium]